MKKNAIAFLLFSASYCSAQKLIPFYDRVNKIHISYPKNWSTGYRDTAYEGISFVKEPINLYGEKNIIEKIEVVRDKETSMTMLSELSLVNVYYPNSLKPFNKNRLKYVVDNFQQSILHGTSTLNLVRFQFYFCHNTDVFLFSGTCQAKEFDRYHKLYTDVVMSIYFD